MNLPTYFRSLRSPLVRRITLVVFLCILAIEAALLIFSWFNERERLLSQFDDAARLVAPIVAAVETEKDFDVLLGNAGSAAQPTLLGVIVEHSDGRRLTRGDVSSLNQSPDGDSIKHQYNSKAGTYDTSIDIQSHLSGYVTKARFRFDASSVNEELKTFVSRIIRMVIAISAFVAFCCVLALQPILLQPLFELRQLMLATQRNGVSHVETPASALNRRDEVGGIYRAFERLRSALVVADITGVQVTNRFQDFADLAADCFWETDHRLRFTFVAGDVESMFGVKPDALIGLNYLTWEENFKVPFPLPPEALQTLRDNHLWEGELVANDSIGKTRTVKVVNRLLKDERGRITGARGIIADTTVASELARELKHQATHDSLTGLVNRSEFEKQLEQAMIDYREQSIPASVCLLDLDRFKIVNDNCGHAAGDLLLKQLADLMREHVRKVDVTSRFGGDEFALLLRGCSLDDGADVAERIRSAIDRYRFYWDGEIFDVGVSIGIAAVGLELGGAAETLRAADACCYKAKNQGRNQVQIYNPTDAALLQQHGEMQWMARITQSIEENRLLLFQQPIVSVTT